MNRPTVLILGVSSFVGSNLAEHLSKDFRVIGTFFNNPVSIKDVTTLRCDVLDKNEIQKIMYRFRPSLTIYCVGLSNIKVCRDFPKVADALNTAGLFNVALNTERFNSRLVYLSSHYVFPGEDVQYLESDSPLPICTYGNTVASSEFFIQKSCLNYLILRCCNLYGRNIATGQRNWFESIEHSLVNNIKLGLDDSIQFGFMDVALVAEVLKLLFTKGVKNRLIQFSSQDEDTFYGFATKMAKIIGGDAGLLSRSRWDFPIEQNFFTMNNSTEDLFFKMDTLNIERAVGNKMPTIAQSLEFTGKRLSSSKEKSSRKKSEGIQFI